MRAEVRQRRGHGAGGDGRQRLRRGGHDENCAGYRGEPSEDVHAAAPSVFATM
jgi:hypothetical protein